MENPLLLMDIDGVISLFGFDPAARPPGRLQFVDGIAHLLSASAGEHLRTLADRFELVWCSGWEEKANEYLPAALGLAGPLPFLELPSASEEHWKLAAIEAYADAVRPLAWVDDDHDERCREWAAARGAPTLLVTTEPAVGLTAEHVEALLGWAQALAASE